MGFSIEGFKGNFRGGGARPSKFEVILNSALNFVGAPAEKFRFTCKAATQPASTVNGIPVKYFGRDVYVAGDRRFDPWQIQVINDEDYLVKNTLEAWMGRINGHETNLNKYGVSDPALYKADAVINQYSQAGQLIKAYRFIGLWPSNIGDIQNSWDAADQVQEFSVTLTYDYWLLDPTPANASDISSVL